MAIAKRIMNELTRFGTGAPLLRNLPGQAGNPGTSRIIGKIDAVSLI
jgi:hypothetical protein